MQAGPRTFLAEFEFDNKQGPPILLLVNMILTICCVSCEYEYLLTSLVVVRWCLFVVFLFKFLARGGHCCIAARILAAFSLLCISLALLLWLQNAYHASGSIEDGNFMAI